MLLLLIMSACSDPSPEDTTPTDPTRTGDGGAASTDGGTTTTTTTDGGAPTIEDTGDTRDTGDTGDTGEPWDPAAPLELCINEFMSSNAAALIREDGSSPDWIELHNPGKEPVDLHGWSITDGLDDPRRHSFGEGLQVEAGAYLLLYADDEPASSSTSLGFKLSDKGGELALYAPDGRGQALRYGTMVTDFSSARVTDCCTGEGCWETVFHGTPGSSNVVAPRVRTTLIEAGSSWRYLDSGAEPEASWTDLSFDDTDWGEGRGPLGFGDTHIVTPVNSRDATGVYPSTWFRRSFTLDAGPALVGAQLRLLVDDGAVVWLNGAELLRQNVAEGELLSTAWATTTTSYETTYTSYSFDPELLVEGDNQLAIRVFQAASTSSDLGFDLTLSVER